MMNKAEQEAYDRALRCERIYKDEIEILQRKINSVLGFCKVISHENSIATRPEILLCKQIITFLKK